MNKWQFVYIIHVSFIVMDVNSSSLLSRSQVVAIFQNWKKKITGVHAHLGSKVTHQLKNWYPPFNIKQWVQNRCDIQTRLALKEKSNGLKWRVKEKNITACTWRKYTPSILLLSNNRKWVQKHHCWSIFEHDSPRWKRNVVVWNGEWNCPFTAVCIHSNKRGI